MKCIHAGSAPCQRCRRSNLDGCGLSLPKTPTGKLKRKRTRQIGDSATPPRFRNEETQANASRQQSEATFPRSRGHSHHSGSRDRENESSLTSDSPLNPYETDLVESHVYNLPAGIVMKSLNVFTNKFPELAILHLPSFIAELRSRSSKEVIALLSAVLAVTRSQICVLNASWGEHLLPREHYALYAKDLLKDLILQHPNIQVVQALLIITLHEWGSRDFHKAWIYCGKARGISTGLCRH